MKVSTRIRTHAAYPKVIAVRFLDLKLKHGVGDSVKEDRETIRKLLGGGLHTRGLINDYRNMREENHASRNVGVMRLQR